MEGATNCVLYLRGMILRADREEIGAAQKAMIEHAMSGADPVARQSAMDDLLSDITAWRAATPLSPLQDAFATVTVAMIERTRLMVGSKTYSP